MATDATPEAPKVFTFTTEEIHHMMNEYQGLCLACGEIRDCCEPDAREYKCEACEEHQVYGIEEAFLMGRIEPSDPDAAL